MKKTKDHFSGHAQQYAQFRPLYPDALYQFLFSQLTDFEKAWDCATGNGQVAQRLAEKFASVDATDISEQQMAQAIRLSNVHYHMCRAEDTAFADNTFGLITVAQALHWFDFEAFFYEAKRVCKPEGLLAVWGYQRPHMSGTLDLSIQHFYEHTIGPYWDEERAYVTHAYQNISFPFEEISAPSFAIDVAWDLARLEGYLNTWSSVQKYIRQHGKSPVPEFTEKLKATGKITGPLPVRFPVFLRVFIVHK